MGKAKSIHPALTALIHIFLWICVFTIPLILREGEREHPEPFAIRPTYVMNQLSMAALFYFNAFLLVPKVLYRRGFLIFLLSAVISILFLAVFVFGINHLFPAGHPFHFDHILLVLLFQGVFVLAISTSYRMFRDRANAEKVMKEKETENLKTELSFLRSQVSPHFMFNVLNNVVSLSRKKSDLVEPVVIKLSHLLRYMLYESDEEQVSLEKELEYLQNYVDLQMLRFGDDVKLNMNIANSPGGSIEPMLLIPFVENAFKHGVVLIDKPQIDISVSGSGHNLEFSVKNKFNDKVNEEKDRNSGIGLNNVKRRLNLLNKDKHTLEVKQEGEWFSVKLTLILK